MYEKPQYLTPGGLRRLRANPHQEATQKIVQAPILPKSTAPLLPIRPMQHKQKGIKISDEAAKLIAEALKTMLHSKK